MKQYILKSSQMTKEMLATIALLEWHLEQSNGVPFEVQFDPKEASFPVLYDGETRLTGTFFNIVHELLKDRELWFSEGRIYRLPSEGDHLPQGIKYAPFGSSHCRACDQSRHL